MKAGDKGRVGRDVPWPGWRLGWRGTWEPRRPMHVCCVIPSVITPQGVLLEELLRQGGRTRSHPGRGADVWQHWGVGSPPTGSAEARTWPERDAKYKVELR